jgi:hypothetical protein
MQAPCGLERVPQLQHEKAASAATESNSKCCSVLPALGSDALDPQKA